MLNQVQHARENPDSASKESAQQQTKETHIKKLKKFQDFKRSLEKRQQNDNLFRRLSNFIYSKPQDFHIEQISQSIKSVMKDSDRYREAIDTMIIIFKYLNKISRTKKVLNQEEQNKFQSKLSTLMSCLNNKIINEWILQIPMAFEHFIKQSNDEVKKYKDLWQVYDDTELNNQKNLQQRNNYADKISQIYRIVFQSDQYEESSKQQLLVVEKIIELKEENVRAQLKIGRLQQRSKSRIQEASQQVQNILKQYKIEGANPSQKVRNLNHYIMQLQSKLKITKRNIETLTVLHRQKQELIAILKINQQKYLEEKEIHTKKASLLSVQLIKNSSSILQPFQSEHISIIQTWMSRNDDDKSRYNRFITKSLLFSDRSAFDKTIFDRLFTQPRIMILVQLHNQIVLGCYIQQQFKEDCYGENDFLFNLTKKQLYERKKNSSIIADKDAIIFGNRQFYLKPEEMKFYTTFGDKKGHFNNKNMTVDDFLCQRNLKEVQVKAFQIYRIGYI